ncbi:MAG: hypothetical protein F6K28_13740 [Microcoleus sp. SIO2G3]|nr:hypothetical protein [Microcoleus sp. SIO2G3]
MNLLEMVWHLTIRMMMNMVMLIEIVLIWLLMQGGAIAMTFIPPSLEMPSIHIEQQKAYPVKKFTQSDVAFGSLCSWLFKQSEEQDKQSGEQDMTPGTSPPQAPSVRIENQQLTDTQLETQIAQGLFHAEIAEVELPSNRLTANGIAALLNSPIRSLQVLNLYDNQIGDAGANLIANAEKFKGVNRLDVSYNNLSFKAIQALFGSESRLTGPTWLNVAGNSIGDAGVELIVESRYAQHLRSLSIRRTGLTDAGVRSIANASGLANLQYLDVSGNELTAAGRETLTNSPYLKQARIVFE